MWIQQITTVDGVVEKCRTEAGATAVPSELSRRLRRAGHSRLGFARDQAWTKSGTGFGPKLVPDSYLSRYWFRT